MIPFRGARVSLAGICLSLLLLLQMTCTGAYESAVRDDLAHQRGNSFMARQAAAHEGPDARRPETADLDRGLSAYLAVALENHPEIQASFERWQASVLRISRARRLPEPTLGFGYFIQSVETRVGPQVARVSLQQTFPWPTKLTAGADAASARARSMQRKFEAQVLMVTQRVASTYWDLWQIRSARVIHREHLDVLHGLSESVRARIATGSASIADLQQFDLAAARLEDSIHGMDESERTAEARLRAAIGMRSNPTLPTVGSPGDAVLPDESFAALAEAASAHPMIASLGFLAEAAESSARVEAADRLPGFTVGADWIVTDEAAMTGVADSGKDAVMVSVGVRVPLWHESYSDSVEAARADAQAQWAEQRVLVDRARAELEAALSSVRDAARRVQLYNGTLVPQAESAYESVLGAYTVGRGTVAQTLLAQRDLLELRVELLRARADHARSWARLEEVTGRQVKPGTTHGNPTSNARMTR